jgi:hypothetical protein
VDQSLGEAQGLTGLKGIIESEVVNMADTGERREIKQRANAHEAEAIRESKELLRKTNEDLSAKKKAPGARSGHRRSKAKK